MSHYRPKDGKDGLPGTHGKDGRDGDKGDIGPMPAHDWVGTNLRFEKPDGEWGEFVDLEGEKGEKGDSIKGEKGDPGSKGDKGDPGQSVRGPKGDKGDKGNDGDQGDTGPMPEHQWQGTSLRFELPSGQWGKYVDLKGPPGTAGSSGGGGSINPAKIPHNDLGGLQGGTVGEYYHLTQTQHTAIATLTGGSTNQNFWRGDLTWSNELEGPFSARSLTDTATLGTTLVTNGAFTGGLTGWTAGTGWAAGTNTAVCTVSGAGTLSQNITVVAGSSYLVTWMQQHSLGNNATITPSIGAATGVAIAYGTTANNTQIQKITALASGSLALTFTPTGGTSGTITLDNVSVQLINEIPFTFELENAAGTGVVEQRANASNTNVAIGLNAGAAITTGTSNTAYGFQAGQSITTGLSNTFVGLSAGLRDTSGVSNTYIGREAGRDTTTGSNNTAVGREAGRSISTGTGNVFYGFQAGINTTTGSSNTFIGREVGTANTTGDSSVFIGFQSGQNNVIGANNVMVGFQSGMGNTSGSSNTYIGYQSSNGASTGTGNTSLGLRSGVNNSSGNSNVFLGRQAGEFQADGVTALTDPDNSVYLGFNCKGFDNSDNNSIVVGASAVGRGSNTAQWGNTSIINHYFSGSIQYSGKVFVTAKSGFPTPVAGVITLANNTNYEISNLIDLGGDRIVCGTNCTLYGQTSDADGLTSTGLSASAKMITSTSSLGIRNLRLSAPTGELFDLNDGATNSLNWSGVQIVDTPTIGTIQNYANIVMSEQIVQNSANMTLGGTIASFVSETSLWDGRTGQATIIVPASTVFTRRFRMLYTAVSVLSGETGISFSTSATIPDEAYILDNVAFSGGGTYLSGIDYTSNKAAFFRNTGITNSSAICQYYMTANATATTIAGTGTFVKVAGTTTAGSLNQKFTTATTNRATYSGALTENFRVVAFATMTSGNNQVLRMRIAKNGVTLTDSTSRFKTTGSGDASSIGTQTFLTMVPADYIEVFVANDTAANDITVTDLTVTVSRIN